MPRSILLLTFSLIGLIHLIGCSKDKNPTQPPYVPGPGLHVIVVTTDYTSGAISVADADTNFLALHNDLDAVHPDAVARVADGLVYVVNRLGGDNVQVLDPQGSFRTIRQFSTGVGSNPHDIAVIAPDRAYVSCNGTPFLLDVDPRNGSVRDSISLARTADRDGIPDMDRLFYRAPYLYVAIQRIDYADSTYNPVPPSVIAIVDTRADTLADADPGTPGVNVITLAGLNPCAPMVLSDAGDVLLIPESGRYGVLDGGVEKVDLTSWSSAGWLVREQDLGGDLIDFALGPDGRGFATVAGPDYSTSLVSFDVASGARTGILYHSDSFDLADLIAVPAADLLLVCDRHYELSGLRAFRASTGLPVTGPHQPVSTGLPPIELIPFP